MGGNRGKQRPASLRKRRAAEPLPVHGPLVSGTGPFDFVGRYRRKHIQAQEENCNQPRQTEPKAAGRKEANNKKRHQQRNPAKIRILPPPFLPPPSNTHVEFRATKRLNWVSKGRKEVVKQAYPPPLQIKRGDIAQLPTRPLIPPPPPLTLSPASRTGSDDHGIRGWGSGGGGRG